MTTGIKKLIVMIYWPLDTRIFDNDMTSNKIEPVIKGPSMRSLQRLEPCGEVGPLRWPLTPKSNRAT